MFVLFLDATAQFDFILLESRSAKVLKNRVIQVLG